MMALVANAIGDKKKPTDYFIPSWAKESKPEGKLKVSLKEVRKNLGSQFIKEK